MKLNEEDISALLSGTIEKLPEKEHIALVFAQNYADTFGDYDTDSYQAVKEKYANGDELDEKQANYKKIMPFQCRCG